MVDLATSLGRQANGEITSKFKVTVFSLWLIICFPVSHSFGTESKETLPFSPFRSSYWTENHSGLPFRKTATRVLEHLRDGSWLYRINASSVGAELSEYSHFRIIDGTPMPTIQPLNYTYNLTGWAVSARVANLSFNHRTLTVLNDVANRPWQMTIPAGTQDKLSVILQLRLALTAGKKKIELPVADGGRLKYYNFEVLGEEQILTQGRWLRCIKVRKTKVPGNGRSSLLWMAPSRQYLLIKLEQIHRDGLITEIHLDNYQTQSP